MSDALSFAEIDGQRVELLPARTVLSASGGFGGDGGDGGDNAKGGDAKGGDGGDANATVKDASNVADHNKGGVDQKIMAFAVGGDGGDAKGGDAGNGGHGGDGGDGGK